MMFLNLNVCGGCSIHVDLDCYLYPLYSSNPLYGGPQPEPVYDEASADYSSMYDVPKSTTEGKTQRDTYINVVWETKIN